VVDFRDYMLALHVITDGSPEEKLAWAFRLFDIDNNGMIDPEEVTEIARSVLQIVAPGAELTPEQARLRARGRANEIFREMDSRGRGYLSQSQFVDSCLRRHALHKMLTHSSCLVSLLSFPPATSASA
jgi:Ca2+-binding EF-hand superfamily protein